MVHLDENDVGKIAVFANLGKAKITKYKTLGYKTCCLYFDGFEGALNYYCDGNFYDRNTTPFDIVALEEGPFDWKDAKWGMAFKRVSDKSIAPCVYIYIGKHPNSDCKNRAIFNIEFAPIGSITFNHDEMERYKEKDLYV